MEKQIINTTSAPAPIGPYNQAILAGDMLFISGQICIDPPTGALKNQDIQQETHQVMHNLRSILTAADMTFHNVVKTTIFITDMNRFSGSISVWKIFRQQQFSAENCTSVGITKI
jgi:2-iminobutanoate/2-iminopropanoate deaminase